MTDAENRKRQETPETEAGGAFWRWSLAFYRQKGVAEALLALQNEHGANVNLALWCLWRSAENLNVDVIDAAQKRIAVFNQSVTTRLRDARNALKAHTSNLNETNALREQILAVELQAEQIEQALLLGDATQASGVLKENCAYRNLQTYLRFDDTGPAADCVRFLARAAAAFEGDDTAL